VATIDLRAGAKGQGVSGLCVGVRVIFSAGMALLDERDWSNQYDLMFSLRLERTECELLKGNFEKASN